VDHGPAEALGLFRIGSNSKKKAEPIGSAFLVTGQCLLDLSVAFCHVPQKSDELATSRSICTRVTE
jgi:hypothetical protein